MSNILPEETIKIVWKRFYVRLILVGGTAAIFVAVLAGLALLPSYIALRTENSSMEQLQTPASLLKLNPQIQWEIDDIKHSQNLVALVSPYISASSSPSETLGIVLRDKPQGLIIGKIGIVTGEKGTMTLVGQASTREIINQYREALSKEAVFTNVSVPVGVLIGSEDGRFTMTLTGDF